MINDQLENWEIRKDLKSLGLLSEAEMDRIISIFWFHDFYNSFISFPDILQKLLEFLRKVRKPFNRPDYYSFLLSQFLNGKSKKSIIQLAVVMESMQVNEISLEKLKQILEKLKTNWKGLDFDKALKNGLITKNNGRFSFRHHTLQEYIAYLFILESDKPLETAKKLMIFEKEGLTAFKSSWSGVLKFLLESKRAEVFLKWILDFARKYPDTVDDNFAEVITSINPDIVPKLKSDIFNLVYDAYFNKLQWIPAWARNNLGIFCNKKDIERFDNDIKPTGNETETFVRRGNVAAVIGSILERNNNLLSEKEKFKWKNILIKLANDDNKNGVLQRNALSALENYQDAPLIEKVKKTYKHESSLVRESFIQFCTKVGPNKKIAIDYFIEAIKGKIDIYGRYGLYEITDKTAIQYLLKKFARDKEFLEKFMDRESIFNTKKQKSDQILIDRIKKHTDDSDVITLLKEIVKNAFSDSHISYTAEKSYFIISIAGFIRKNDKKYLFEILTYIEQLGEENKIWHQLCDCETLFATLIDDDNLDEFAEKVKKIHSKGDRIVDMVVWKAKYLRPTDGQKIFNFAASKKLVAKPKEEKTVAEEKKEKDERIFNEFKRLLEPEKGKYFPAVFEYYISNKSIIDKLSPSKELARLKKLALEGLDKIDPAKIEVTITNLGAENKNYKISAISNYYGDILRVGHLLFPKELPKYRQNIINFIPFSYHNDLKTIYELVPDIKTAELESYVYPIYLNRKKHIRYLLSGNLADLISHYLEKGVSITGYEKILKDFLEDKYISEYDKRQAVELMGANNKADVSREELKNIFVSAKDNKTKEAANASLINLYKDEEAIKWRFDEIRNRFTPFVEPEMGIAHSVSELESEMDSLTFAKPLIDLKDIKYLPVFFDLLKFSFEKLKEPENKNYRPYVYYIWKIVIAYLDGLKTRGSFEPINDLKKWLDKYDKAVGLNWLRRKVDGLTQSYIDYHAKND